MARSSPSWTVPLVLSVALVGGSAALAGCSDDGPTASSSRPSASSQPSASSTGTEPSATPSDTPGTTADPAPTTEAAPAVPPARKGRAGQVAFAEHVMDTWAYALRTNDADPLSALGAQGTCRGCKPFARELAKRRAQGWSVDFPGVEVRKVKVTRDGNGHRARATVDLPESDSFNSDGSFRNTNRAREGSTFEVRMRLTQKGYRLLSFTVS